MTDKAVNELTWVIGGAQGSGVDSAANIFSKTCAEDGLYIFGKREYYSNIKGEHSYFTVRVSNKQIRSHRESIDILVSFDAETVFRHAKDVSTNGIIIFNSELIETSINEIPTLDEDAQNKIIEYFNYNDSEPFTIKKLVENIQQNSIECYGIPYYKILKDFSEHTNNPALSKLARMINVLALSISLSFININRQALSRAIKYIFRTKPKIAEINIAAAEYAYNYSEQKFQDNKFSFYKNKRDFSDIILVQGSQSSALGKIVAGCRFQTYYPITPASEDSEFLESNQIIEQMDGKKGSVLVMQTEDEIAAITMAIGGALTGTRTSTATSGPGFSLMAEALGWAGINEVPLVVSLYQRAGPSTGLPTRHEQGDLLFAINAGHGEFPRIVFASGDIEESFYDTLKIFNFADIFQLPVIHLLDKAIASSVMTCKNFDPNKINIDRGYLVTKINNKEQDNKKLEHFKRFKLKENEPISSRTPIGTENGIFWNTGDEHNEEGHIIEDPTVRIKMMNKRMTKLELILQTIPDEDKALSYNGNSDIVITSWGSTKGAILDTLDELNKEGIKIKFVQIKLLNPFPQQLLKKLLHSAKTIINIEMNYSSQLAKLIKQNLQRDIDYEIVKYNGRPISYDEIHKVIKDIVNNNIDKRRIVLDHGA
ncbi:MAG TPA: 2-oxoacid:ferredoxin oxidoreductase subunit alpha [Nitrososphaeraceae archaeon]|jgi:2-oxoglutarate ferredoxin oxidoreductase subunit alpha|nr:2-oxoacid:ferredoxin oxidoreductase subunit alpha [Nitrososphaeraceae archaeon]HEU5172392.1 2-oxoacid:ferredoxin oxidoreductase subunit alpha [Nitrososphaeraceae archaeon]